MTSAAKLERLENQLSGTALKVFEAVPCDEIWSTNQIASELYRQHKAVEHRFLQGALNNLVEQGLIKEPSFRQYTRNKPGKVVQMPAAERPITAAAVAVPSPSISLVPPPAEPVPLLTKFATLAGDLRVIAAKFEDLALEVEQQIQNSGEAADQLKKLQTILRAIGGFKE